MKTNQLKSGVILSYASMIVQNIITIFYTPVMLKILGQSEYGLYQLAASTVSYLGVLSFGFGSSYVRFYSRYKSKEDQAGIKKLNGMFMIIFLIIAAITLLAGSVLVINVENIFGNSLTPEELHTAEILMGLMVVNLAISFPSSVFDCYLTAHEAYIVQRTVSLLQTVLNPFLALPLLLMGYKSVSLVVVTTIITILKLFVNIYYCIRKLKMRFDFRKMQFGLLKEVGIFSFYIFLNMIVDQVNWSVDKFILGIFGGTIPVAIYGVGAQINYLYKNLSSSISSVFIPRVNRIVESGEEDRELTMLFTKVGRIQFMVLALVLGGFVVIGKFFIVSIWAGQDYMKSYYVALLLIVPVTIPLIQNLGIEIQRAKNMHKFRSILYFIIAIGNCLLSIPLAQKYAEIGSAIGTFLSLIIGNGLIMNIYYHKKVGLDMKYFWKEILKLLPSFGIVLIVTKIITIFIPVDSLIHFIVIGAIYVILYCVLTYFFGMNEYEQNLVKEPVMKVLKRGKS